MFLTIVDYVFHTFPYKRMCFTISMFHMMPAHGPQTGFVGDLGAGLSWGSVLGYLGLAGAT
jgi:hypothetical protein